MRASRLLSAAPADFPAAEGLGPGQAELVRGGWVVSLGPGLLAGTPLLAAVVERVSRALAQLAQDLGARPVVLPASEGEALVNVLLHAGAAPSSAAVLAWAQGAGFREQTSGKSPLGEAQLYPRMDLAAVGPSDAGMLRTLRGACQRTLGDLGLALDPPAPASGPATGPAPGPAPGPASDGSRVEIEWAAGSPGHAPIVVGRLATRPLGGGGLAAIEALLVSFDLFAIVAALAEQHHDERGLAWPSAVAPFLVGIIPPTEDHGGLASKLTAELEAAGIATLLDDRPLPPARKRLDAERWGLPLRVLCGPTSAQGQLVVESRAGGHPTRVAAADLVAHVLSHVAPSASAARRLRLATY